MYAVDDVLQSFLLSYYAISVPRSRAEAIQMYVRECRTDYCLWLFLELIAYTCTTIMRWFPWRLACICVISWVKTHVNWLLTSSCHRFKTLLSNVFLAGIGLSELAAVINVTTEGLKWNSWLVTCSCSLCKRHVSNTRYMHGIIIIT